MKRILGALAAMTAIALCPSVANATNVVITPATPVLTFPVLALGQTATFIVSGNPFSGPLSATFSDGGIPTGPFTDMFKFLIPQNGTGSGTVTTTTDTYFSTTDLDISSVVVSNGVTTVSATPTYRDASNHVCTNLAIPTCGVVETFAVTNYPVVSGLTNTITVNGLSRGLGGYSGVATFTPSVPEPATWAMMLLGFGALGFSMRRRPRTGLAQIA